MNAGRRISFFVSKIYRFEFWPYWLFYFPMYFYGLYLALRARSFMYFSTTNPGMLYSGVMGVSKSEVLKSIPSQYIPKTVFVPKNSSEACIIDLMQKNDITYPFIIKPDVGERGTQVEKINNAAELADYMKQAYSELNLQEFISHELEFGIMYHRIPGETKGAITSVVRKGFLTVFGDGKHTLSDLLENEIRVSNRLQYLEHKFGSDWNRVLEKGERTYVEPIGNHCRGTIFYNANELIDDRMRVLFDKIASTIDGYYYGRFDLKVPTVESLYTGEGMKIIELNGVSSEVAHVYDPDYKLIRAYRDIAKHMKYIARIARANYKKGIKRDSLPEFLQDLRKHLKEKKSSAQA